MANQSSNNDNQKEPNLNPAEMVSSPDLINQPNFPEDPEETITNPAVAPQMLDDRRDSRGDLTRDES